MLMSFHDLKNMKRNYIILLLFLQVTLIRCQKVKFEDESTTTDGKSENSDDHNSENEYRTSKYDTSDEYKNIHDSGKATNDLVSRQYGSNFPPYPSPFQTPYNKYPSMQFGNNGNGGANWEWAPTSGTTQQSRKPSFIQFPGDGLSSGSAYNSLGTSSSHGRNQTYRGSSFSSAIRIDDSCHCGMLSTGKESKKLQRIVGGIVSKDNAWPWMVSIAYIGQSRPFWFCGGSLISDKFVLTAAHCLRTIRNFGFPNIKLIMGTSNITDSKSAVHYSIRAIRPHPLYKSGTEDYDVALLELKEKVNFTSKISPICLFQEDDSYINRTVTVAGWGSLQNGEGPPADLREVDLKVVANDDCQKEYYYHYQTSITSSMICAWLPGRDSCSGDSGSPLFLKTTTAPYSYTQIGIVSFGPPQCGKTTIPGVYSRVASAIRWIKSVTKTGKFCKGSF